ncbi:MAG: 5-oxoprolinase subunit PxpA [Rhizobiaceae bacterium]|nr:5-oxoprolinase subunit PxpA [Rhizobiaceae bacterium]
MAQAAKAVDLNSDMGEGFGAYSIGNDAALLDIVTSANVACGFHAGDPEIMASTFALARERNVAVGAHPGYQDLWGFGRRAMTHTNGEIERLVAYQIGAAQALSAYAGHPITYVKAHGALSHHVFAQPDAALAFCRAIKAVDSSLVCLVMAFGAQERAARDLGLEVRTEIFADRAYADTGGLMPRGAEGAVIHDPEQAAERAVRMVREGAVVTATGKLLPTQIDSICVHSDTPDAISIAKAVRAGLESNSVAIRAFAPLP